MKSFIIIIGFLFCQYVLLADINVSGISIPSNKQVHGKSLLLNGVGTREKYWMDMYVGALYLPKKSTDAQYIIQSNEIMMIELTIVSSLITSNKMSDAVDEGFENSTNGNTGTLQQRIQQFKSSFKEEIKKGDVYTMAYDPEKGTVVYKNGKLATTIPGLDFKRGLFGIWLCNKPADNTLKKALLGL